MSEEKKKQVRKVSVDILNNGTIVGEEVYKGVVAPDSTVDKEIAWRLAHIKDEQGMSWKIDSDDLIREV